MTLEEASQRFCLSITRLRAYAGAGLLAMPDSETQDYSEEQIRRAATLQDLQKAGFTMDDLKRYVQAAAEGAGGQETQVRMLRKQRNLLLDQVHEQQQCIDSLDYMIHRIKSTGQAKVR